VDIGEAVVPATLALQNAYAERVIGFDGNVLIMSW
jgi:hypothetical protein